MKKETLVIFGKLIFALEKIDGLERLRYCTSHPLDMHDDLYEAHAICKKLMPLIHLPVPIRI